MATAVEGPSELDILTEVFDLGERLGREHARWVLTLHFSARQRARIVELNDKGNRGQLTPEEHAELDRYRRVGMVLNLMQAKAEFSLQHSGDEQ